jgi:hypothetical protein
VIGPGTSACGHIDGDPAAATVRYFCCGLVNRAWHVVRGRSIMNASTGHIDGGSGRAQLERHAATCTAACASNQRDEFSQLCHVVFALTRSILAYQGESPLRFERKVRWTTWSATSATAFDFSDTYFYRSADRVARPRHRPGSTDGS